MPQLWTDRGCLLTLDPLPPSAGGEAAVYRARTAQGDLVAIKVPLDDGPPARASLDLAERLATDPRTAFAFVPILDRGTWESRPFAVLPWLPETLAAWRGRGPTAAEGRTVALRLARAVAAMHAAGEVHGDLKPTNVLMEGATPLLTDPLALGGTRVRRTTTVIGCTPGWAAPEVATSEERTVTMRADVYALAATTCFVLTGEPPATPSIHAEERGGWLGGPRFAACRALCAADDAALRRAGVAPSVRAALAEALRADPSARPADARALVEAIQHWSTDTPPRRRARWQALAATALLFVATDHAPIDRARASVSPIRNEVPALPVARIPAGTPRADGSPLPADLMIMTEEVDQATWRRLLGEDPVRDRRTFEGGALGERCATYREVPLAGDHLPALCVDFFDAIALAQALSDGHGLRRVYTVEVTEGARWPVVHEDATADGWRLPTRLEWRSFIRSDPPSGSDCAWRNIADASLAAALPWPVRDAAPCDDGYAGPAPGGSFPPNPWGIHDAHGNVAEWGADADEDGRRLVFGGAWAFVPAAADPSRVGFASPDLRTTTLGVRLVRGGR